MRTSLWYLALGISFVTTFAGCSLIGHSIGNSIDESSSRETRTLAQIAHANTGDTVHVRMRNGEVIHGVFLYTQEYSGLREHANQWPTGSPRTGDSITLFMGLNPQKPILTTFLDYSKDRRALLCMSTSPRGQFIVPIRSIDSLVVLHGNAIPGEEVRQRARSYEFLVAIGVDSQTRMIDTADIKTLSWHSSSSTGETVGTMIGAGIDAALVIGALFLLDGLASLSLNFNSPRTIRR